MTRTTAPRSGEEGSGPRPGEFRKAGAGGSLLGLLFLLVLAAAFLAGAPADPADGLQPPQERDPSHFANYFRREESGDAYLLTYGWEGFRGRAHRVRFRMAGSVVRESAREYGYVLTDLNRHLDETQLGLQAELLDHLEDVTRRLIDDSRYREYISIVRSDPDSREFKLKVSAPPEVREEVKAEFDRITRKILSEQKAGLERNTKARDAAYRSYIEARGLRFVGDKIAIDYGLSVRRNRPRVKPVLQALKTAGGKLNLHAFLSYLLAFIQEIRYGLPPLEEEGRYILEFWPPPVMLVNNLGDCDSKSVAFASLWTQFRNYPLLLIKIPNHMLVGVAVPTYAQEGVVINGLRYTLMEVTGPDKLAPGLIFPRSRTFLESGNYIYEMIR